MLGATLGALWTPCAGPVLASVLALVASADEPQRAAVLLVGYAMGAGLPMLAVAYGGQAVATRSRSLARHAGRIRQGFGVLVLAAAVAMQARVDGAVVNWVSQWWPDLAESRAQPALVQAEAAPEFAGIDRWFNTAPLSMRELRGRVVLVDFWTFGCANCQRTLPHLVRWDARFRDAGLTIVGVHTPEFAHEHSARAVQTAIEQYGIRYAVAQDNRFRTWAAYRNRYWPALYLIDREGRIVYRHVGEDGYDEVQREIERILMSR
jgi:thiol-disulfide isomerase/thioredoxin